MKERVRITDVSPRDGLQNEAGIIPTADKVRLIELLCATGVDEIEVTSFVSPKWVPQLGDAREVVEAAALLRDPLPISRRPELSVLIPNVQGLHSLQAIENMAEAKMAIGKPHQPLIQKVSLFTAASESFSRRNTNATIEETFERFKTLLKEHRYAPQVRGYVSCAIACPFEGPISPVAVSDVAARFADLGATDIDLGDTIGSATPETTARLLECVEKRIGPGWFERRALTLHLHDTFGRAADCVKIALDMGVRSFDGSVAGLGGCPYASKKLPDGTIQRAPGNISTELLVQTIEDAGYETSVDRDALAKAAAFAREIVAKSRAGA